MRNDRILADFYRIFRILCCCERIRNYKRIGTGNCIRDCYCIPLISVDGVTMQPHTAATARIFVVFFKISFLLFLLPSGLFPFPHYLLMFHPFCFGWYTGTDAFSSVLHPISFQPGFVNPFVDSDADSVYFRFMDAVVPVAPSSFLISNPGSIPVKPHHCRHFLKKGHNHPVS